MNPILGVGLVVGITALAVWAAWKWREFLVGRFVTGDGPVSPDGESSDPGWGDPLPDAGVADGGD